MRINNNAKLLIAEEILKSNFKPWSAFSRLQRAAHYIKAEHLHMALWRSTGSEHTDIFTSSMFPGL